MLITIAICLRSSIFLSVFLLHLQFFTHTTLFLCLQFDLQQRKSVSGDPSFSHQELIFQSVSAKSWDFPASELDEQRFVIAGLSSLSLVVLELAFYVMRCVFVCWLNKDDPAASKQMRSLKMTDQNLNLAIAKSSFKLDRSLVECPDVGLPYFGGGCISCCKFSITRALGTIRLEINDGALKCLIELICSNLDSGSDSQNYTHLVDLLEPDAMAMAERSSPLPSVEASFSAIQGSGNLVGILKSLINLLDRHHLASLPRQEVMDITLEVAPMLFVQNFLDLDRSDEVKDLDKRLNKLKQAQQAWEEKEQKMLRELQTQESRCNKGATKVKELAKEKKVILDNQAAQLQESLAKER
ncbi:hypothetical protein BUALT_Bualt05G0126700 [Buddleja alternifolia]|uniref:Uncharacterized protein n=1 Tax=Buddleja alternifolia TaxID=168488 RepID=A0AAV6XRG9_9LAMI|nr:hypothetical protein BUALT_Bualt05G0126700 [Buddleja alternifolia]